jgi:hypothetical protein
MDSAFFVAGWLDHSLLSSSTPTERLPNILWSSTIIIEPHRAKINYSMQMEKLPSLLPFCFWNSSIYNYWSAKGFQLN